MPSATQVVLSLYKLPGSTNITSCSFMLTIKYGTYYVQQTSLPSLTVLSNPDLTSTSLDLMSISLDQTLQNTL